MDISNHLAFWGKSVYFGFAAKFFTPRLSPVRLDSYTQLVLRRNTADEFILWEIWRAGEYSHPKFKINPHDTILDIGAHIGIFTVYAAQRARQGKVIAYEPHPDNFKLLAKNVGRNKLHNVTLYNQAVFPSGRGTTLYMSPTNTGGHSLLSRSDQAIKITCLPLERIFDQNKINHIDLLKIDAEGSEYDIIFKSPLKTLHKVHKMVVEYHDQLPTRDHRQVINYLHQMGFKTETKTFWLQRRIVKSGVLFAYK